MGSGGREEVWDAGGAAEWEGGGGAGEVEWDEAHGRGGAGEEDRETEREVECWVLWVGSLAPAAAEEDLLAAVAHLGPVAAVSVTRQQNAGYLTDPHGI